MKQLILRAASAAVIALYGGAAQAAPTVLDFSCPTPGVNQGFFAGFVCPLGDGVDVLAGRGTDSSTQALVTYSLGEFGLGTANFGGFSVPLPSTTGVNSIDGAINPREGWEHLILYFDKAVSLSAFSLGFDGYNSPTSEAVDSDVVVYALTGSFESDSSHVQAPVLAGMLNLATNPDAGWVLVGDYGNVGELPGKRQEIDGDIFANYWSFGIKSASIFEENSCAIGTQTIGSTDVCADAFTLKSVELRTAEVSEPASLALLGVGMMGLVGARRRRG